MKILTVGSLPHGAGAMARRAGAELEITYLSSIPGSERLPMLEAIEVMTIAPGETVYVNREGRKIDVPAAPPAAPAQAAATTTTGPKTKSGKGSGVRTR